ncbi:hypothetical protein CPB85DRAFT_1432556 [Mucidula mucida]|nr:hypothetical protein CPB85DRAFT_1432556 [Mucidula mucida]
MSLHDAPTQLTAGLVAEERHEQSIPVDSAESRPLSHDTIRTTCPSDQCAAASSTKSLSEKSLFSSDIGPLFYPVAPTHFERYLRPFVVPNTFISCTIPRATVEFSSRQLPPEWECFSHPEGASYFRCQHELFTVFTDAHPDRQDIHMFLEERILEIVSYISLEKRHSDLASIAFDPQNVDLVLDVTSNGEGENVCGYYLVYHKTRAVFWLDDFDASGTLWSQENGVESMDHIQHEIQSEYWLHCSYFPAALNLTRDIIQELRDILLHAIGDTLISPTAISQFSNDDLCAMLGLLDVPLRDTLEMRNHGLSRIVYVLLKMFAHERFIHFHGQPAARLDLGVSVYDKHAKRTHSLLFGIVRCLLFNAPYVQLREIQNILMGIDGIVSPRPWKEFMSRLRKDWNEVTIYSTLLVNANVGFLAIQSVDETNQGGNSPVRIPIYISMISALGSVLFSLLLLRHTKRKATVLSSHAVRDLEGTQSFLRGNEQLAVLYSLPYGLMMWSVTDEPTINKSLEDIEEKKVNTASDPFLDDESEDDKWPTQEEIEEDGGDRGREYDNYVRTGTKGSATATNKPSGVKNGTSVKTSTSSTSSTSKPTNASGAAKPSNTSKPSSAKGATPGGRVVSSKA